MTLSHATRAKSFIPPTVCLLFILDLRDDLTEALDGFSLLETVEFLVVLFGTAKPPPPIWVGGAGGKVLSNFSFNSLTLCFLLRNSDEDKEESFCFSLFDDDDNDDAGEDGKKPDETGVERG